MVRNCLFCGEEFHTNWDHQKFCSKECRDHIRWKHTRAELQQRIADDKKMAVELYSSTLSTKQIAGLLNRQPAFVYNAWHEAGLKKRPTEFQRKVAELREEGRCSVEIAEELGKSTKHIIDTAKLIGMPFTDEEVARSVELGKSKSARTRYGNIEARAAKFIQENRPGFSYVSGNIGGDGMMQLRCECCGSLIEKSAVTVRHNEHIICPVCEERKKEAELKAREEKKKQRSEAFWAQEFKQNKIGWKACPECGALHLTKNSKYCSDKCRRRAANRSVSRHKDKRLNSGNIVDKDIDLKKLYARDHGICWICGDKCEYSDQWIDENGSFCVGALYPSIDHVVPLSRGGLHAWDNVKLAHHYCNTLKNDKVVSL